VPDNAERDLVDTPPTYRQWLSGVASRFSPVAFDTINWDEQPEVRRESHARICEAVDASIDQYFEAYPQVVQTIPALNVGRAGQILSRDVRRYRRVGNQFNLYGGLLAVETFIHMMEHRLCDVFPELYTQLNWSYPYSSNVLDRYLDGFTVAQLKDQFIKDWNQYVAHIAMQDNE